MANVTTESLLLSGKEEADDRHSDPTNAVAFVGLCLLLGIACRHILHGTRVPYTVALLVLGVALGSLEYGTHLRFGLIGDGIRIWANIDPDLLLAVFLPALLFEGSFSMDVHQIKKCMVEMIILAGPGVLLSTFCLGSALKLTFPYNWTWKTSFLLGGLLSATDPVAVVSHLKELGASKKLSTIIEGESMMNDGVSIVIYQLFYQMVLGKTYDWGAIIQFLSEVSLGAVGIGLAYGIISVLWIRFIVNDTVLEITVTIAVSYIAYYTAQQGVAVSGVLTVMTLGMFYAAVAKTAFKGESQQCLNHFWEMVAYIANTLIFILSGVVIAEGVLEGDIMGTASSWAYLALLYVYVHVTRCIVVGVTFLLLRCLGYVVDWKEAIIIIWSGLRGAVSLSLALSVKRTSDSSSVLSADTGAKFIFFTGGIVFLTIIVNGSTTQFILHFLDMDKLSTAKMRLLEYTKYEMLNKALEAFGVFGDDDDEELGPVDWPTVKKYIASLNDMDGEPVYPHTADESDNNSLDLTDLKDMRELHLNGVQAAYWYMLDEGRITQSTANILMQSVDEAFDLVKEPLCDWKGLKSQVLIPSYYKFLQTSICPQKLVTYFTAEMLESSCSICAAFLRAHRIARQQLHDLTGDSDVASIIIGESEAEGEGAKRFLDNVRVTFPQVLRVLKTRQVTYSVLNHLIEYLQNMEKVGLLEEKEMLHLHDAVQTDLQRLLRNPPLEKIPKINDLINLHPMTRALPSSVLQPLEVSFKETMSGMTLYKEGSKPIGIWLISTGVVKWTSRRIKNRHSLYRTFTHGSTLGLYEVLTGKPYICDMITDSVVLSLFIDFDKIHSMLRSDPSVEDLLWQESAIILLKLLFPQKFEKMPMQDLRALIAERSTLTNYSAREFIEIPCHSVGFLLEGSVKTQGIGEELITSPAPLLPSHGCQSSRSLETAGTKGTQASFTHQVSIFLVETSSIVIVFDMAAFESDTALVRGPSSFRTHAGGHLLRTRRREHSGLMSWSEHFTPKHHRHPEATYGSMLNDRQRNGSFARSFPTNITKPNVPLPHNCPLVSVKSEGLTTMADDFELRAIAGKASPPGRSSTAPKSFNPVVDDASGGEDDVIIRID